MAHKGQVKLREKTERRRNITLRFNPDEPTRGTKRKHVDSIDEGEVSGVLPALSPPPPARSEMHPRSLRSANEPRSDPVECYPVVRRSNRNKKKKIDGNFVYYK